MRDRPIPMHARSIQNLLAGRKTQTRRICKFKICSNGFHFDGNEILCHVDELPPATMLMEVRRGKDRYWNSQLEGWEGECPYGVPGDLLWVRESWAQRLDLDHLNGSQLFAAGVREAWYWADGPGKCARTGCAGAAGRHRAARFMPRWASRLTLELTDVRVERVQAISHADAEAEGCRGDDKAGPADYFADLWNDTNGPGAWERNDWVWVLGFRVHRCNVDQLVEVHTGGTVLSPAGVRGAVNTDGLA